MSRIEKRQGCFLWWKLCDSDFSSFFFSYIFQRRCFWGCDLTYLHSSEYESSVLMVELQNGLVWKGALETIQFQSPTMEVMWTEQCRAPKVPYPTHRTMVQATCADTHRRRVDFITLLLNVIIPLNFKWKLTFCCDFLLFAICYYRAIHM